jgi:hypothetical protein
MILQCQQARAQNTHKEGGLARAKSPTRTNPPHRHTDTRAHTVQGPHACHTVDTIPQHPPAHQRSRKAFFLQLQSHLRFFCGPRGENNALDNAHTTAVRAWPARASPHPRRSVVSVVGSHAAPVVWLLQGQGARGAIAVVDIECVGAWRCERANHDRSSCSNVVCSHSNHD